MTLRQGSERALLEQYHNQSHIGAKQVQNQLQLSGVMEDSTAQRSLPFQVSRWGGINFPIIAC
jgi:hypothetical protein